LCSQKINEGQVISEIGPKLLNTLALKSRNKTKLYSLRIYQNLLKAIALIRSGRNTELIDGQQEYEVEEIIDDRSYRCKQQYLVRWLGYPASENSWVNAKDLHSPELLAEYCLSKA
jgi:hypothetical protein